MPHMSRDAVYAGSLLGYSKSLVRNTSAAITETASPAVREMLSHHLQQGIHIHQAIFNYMLQHNLYPAYSVEQIVQNDIRNAHFALSMPIKQNTHQDF